jgi:membrane protein DedA with SNARE-associated domain
VLAHFIATYGYLAVFVGTLFEGETILLLGGFAAHRGHLSLPIVIVVAFAGSLLGDQTMFWIGHRYGKRLVKKWPNLERRVERVRPLLDRFGNVAALLFRFLYGLRNATPLAMAIGGFAPRRFVLLNAIGAAVWAVGVGTIGYLLGEAAALALPRAHRYQTFALVAILCAAAAFWIVRRLWPRRNAAPR